ncbi:GntR family transcriptional regulator [Alicyclobacillus dauci]|uniref:GntR family transcriptional regulator n=1 Tax=Alicyclobacillus dauci TaxID=1475485 RepID=A0ABY6Z4V4_9BACL|nr:GntR family transcriptional regulator [Alicyclobacillus dauci]WAH37894.1 GntR family transcriptional regulator [Alicyclobacillus dauci]
MQIQKQKSVSEQIYDLLFSQIIDGTLLAGTRLAEEKIAAQLGVSRTPVRESILRLEHDGLLRNKYVIEPTRKDIDECYEVRILMEGYAARKAATCMSVPDKQALKELIEEAKSGDFGASMKAHTVFHNVIVRASNNEQISHVIERMQAIILLCRRDVVRHRSSVAHEHDNILQAIIDGDADLAETLMKQHLTDNYEDMLSRVPTHKEPSSF